MDDIERRALLRALAGSAAASATVGLAGCADRGFLGGGTADGSYLFEPGTVADGDHYTVRFAAPDVVSAHDVALTDETVTEVENRAAWLYEVTDTEFEAASAQLTFRSVAVVELDHDPETVEDVLDDGSFEEYAVDEYGYRIFRSEDEGRAVGFDGATLVGATPAPDEPDPEDVVVEVLRTEAGDVPRYDETNDAFGAVTDELTGDAFLVRSHEDTDDTDVGRGRFDDEIVRGLTASFGGAASEVRIVLAFEEAEDIVLDDVAAWTETEAFGGWSDVSVDATGAVVTVSGTVDTGAVELRVPRGQPSDAPLAWIPSPDALGFDEGFSIRRSAPETLAGIDGVPESFRDTVAGGDVRSLLDLDEPALELIDAGPIGVGRTDRDEADLEARVRDADFERLTGYDGFTLYEDPSSSRAVAVEGGTVVVGRELEDVAPAQVVTTTIDAVGGDAELYVEASEPLATVRERMDLTPVTIYRPGRRARFDGAQASGIQFDIGTDRTELTFPFVFEDVQAAESADLRQRFADNLDDFDSRRDGRVVVVTGTVATDELA